MYNEERERCAAIFLMNIYAWKEDRREKERERECAKFYKKLLIT